MNIISNFKVATVVGARPQFVKAAAISRRLRCMAREVLIHTGQHYDANMSEVFFQELEIPAPDYHLDVGSGTHGKQTGEMLEEIEEVLLQEKPDWVLVYGDTNSTLAGALAAAKLHIPVAHVEAGLRSFNRRMPEEINRVLTDHLAALLLAPTEVAVRNLRKEGLMEGVELVGDVMYEVALEHLKAAEQHSRILERLGLNGRGFALATVHRAENTDDPSRLSAILDALGRIGREYPVVLPLHPRTREAARRLSGAWLEHLQVTEPLPYLDMVRLESQARLILTDSGGVQKEAFFFHVPCITLRDETEWVETVDSGWNVLAGAEPERIVHAARSYKPGSHNTFPYGRGDASRRIIALLLAAGEKKTLSEPSQSNKFAPTTQECAV
ncbi:MAG TPA: UDP-N-acetylglucosamine 2-epimerase (non-hydrolyzing) [Terriglobia bacterium]|nr:UDP-N-acetylglucosamine 2-epimerase (non-hydrolyzing) [Terriglobia bacterium]